MYVHSCMYKYMCICKYAWTLMELMKEVVGPSQCVYVYECMSVCFCVCCRCKMIFFSFLSGSSKPLPWPARGPWDRKKRNQLLLAQNSKREELQTRDHQSLTFKWHCALPSTIPLKVSSRHRAGPQHSKDLWVLSFFSVCLINFCRWVRVLICTSCYPRTHSIDQSGIQLN